MLLARIGGLTLAVVAEGHLCLAEANGVFSLRDAIELLELGLVDALHGKSGGAPKHAVAGACALQDNTCLAGEIQLNGLDTDVGGTGSHVCDCGVGE
jgi:hypothetical protein